MAKVVVVTDSTADVPKELCDELGITVVPLKVNFSESETYEDRVTLSPSQFFQKVREYDSIPTTSQPTPYQFEEIYASLLEQEDTSVISIHLSSKLSGTYQAATIAKAEMDDDARIHVVDSKKGFVRHRHHRCGSCQAC